MPLFPPTVKSMTLPSPSVVQTPEPRQFATQCRYPTALAKSAATKTVQGGVGRAGRWSRSTKDTAALLVQVQRADSRYLEARYR